MFHSLFNNFVTLILYLCTQIPVKALGFVELQVEKKERGKKRRIERNETFKMIQMLFKTSDL